MIRNFPKGLRRFGAMAMSLILLVIQVVIPVAALAADPSLLPNVTIYYQLSAEESPMSQMIMANSVGNEYVYWGVLPQEAFNNPMSIDVQGNDPSISYDPASGTSISASPATSVDGSSMATTIQVYQDGSAIASFPVYLATVDMPPVEVEPEPISVSLPIYYVDENGDTLGQGTTETYTAEGSYTVYADEGAWTGNDYEFTNGTSRDVYVDANGTASPSEIIFNVKKKAVDISVSLPIYYVDENGETLGQGTTETYTAEGSYTVYADEGTWTGNDYEFTNGTSRDVYVDANGTASPSEIIFNVKKKAVDISVSMPIYYVDENGETLGQGTTETYTAEGSYTVHADEADWTAKGYVFTDGTSRDVYVDANGTASLSEIIFNVKVYEEPATPISVSLPIYYVDDNGETLGQGTTETYTAEGSYTVHADEADWTAKGYVFTDGTSRDVYVDANGTASLSEIIFNVKVYEEPATPISVSLPIYYVDDNGETLGQGTTETYTAEGSYTVHADEADWTAKGYVFTDGTSRDVYVDANGTASLSEIIFNVKVYEEPVTPISVTIPISYLNQADNAVIASDSVTYTQAGEYSIDAAAQEGFELVDPTSVLVTVLADGTASHSAVTFYAIQKSDPDPVEELTPINSDGVTIKGNLNLRSAPIVETGNEVFKGVKIDVTVWVYGSVVNSAGETWYKIKYQDTDCYIRSDMLKLVESTAKSADVKIQYIDQASGTAFFEDQITIDAGAQQEIKVDAANAAGYTLQGEGTVVVTVDADGVANINPVVFTFAKNEVTGTVHTEYADENGVYATEDLLLSVGDQQPITPNVNHVKAGYTLTSEATVMVNVSADGSVSPSTVTFTYQAPVADVKADVTFTYTDTDGNAIAGLDAQTVTLSKGSYSTVEYRRNAPDGYLFDHASHEQIVIDENGANPAAVQFFYSKQEVLGSMTFYFLDDKNNEMSPKQTIQLAPDTYDAANFAMVAPEGYTYQGASAASFSINAQGDASPASITYTYVRSAVAPAVVSISYVNAEGYDILPSTTRELAADRTYPASDFLLAAPEGYEYVGASADQIVVDANGAAMPASLVFTYQTTKVVTGDVVFQYKTTTGNEEVSPSATVSLEQGENDMNEHISVFPGYTFDSKSADFVTVTKDGKANPSTVTFYYTKDVTSTTIQVHYVNAIGEDFANSPQLVMIGKGTHTIRPDAAYVPAGYELSTSSAQTFEVVVNDQMIATPNSITFKYYDSTKNANITVNYINQVTGAVIATKTVSRAPGTHAIEPESGAVDMTKFNLAPASPSSVNVTVTEQSVASPATVTFYYVPVEVDAYMGYLLTINQANLFSMASNLEGQILQTLPVNTLLYTNGQKTQSNGVVWNSAYTVLGTTNAGYVKDSDVKRISQAEAEALIAKYNEENQPTPEQSTGYYITRGNNVPFRKAADPYSSAKYLAVDTVIYVLGQTTAYNYDWHQAQYQGVTGYVRTDQVRKMTEDEVKAYLASQKDPETPGTGTEVTNDPNSNSSYGYVSSSNVNFRATPNGKKLKTINKYGMALILGTKDVNGVTWYNVNYNGTIGWIHGSYFYQMTLSEMRSFVGSTEYYKGLSSNSISNGSSSSSGSSSSGSSSSGSSSGTSSQGGLASVEDGNAGTWQNTGVTGQTSYEPFNPYATPSVTTSIGPSESPEPSPTLAIGTMIPIDYDDESKETQTGTVPWGLLGAAGVLICGAGGVYAYALNQNKRRKTAAQRAAAGRKTAQGAAGSKTAQSAAGSKTTQGAAGSTSTQQGQNPYARRAVVAPPVTGAKQNQTTPTTPQGPATGATTGGVRNPYASGSITGASTTGNPYAKPQSTTSQSTAAPILPPSGASTNAGGTPIGRPSSPSSAPIQGTAGSASMTRPSSLSGSDTTAPTSTEAGSPMTRPSSLSGAAAPTASTGTNPYARPIGTMPAAPTPPTPPTAPTAPTGSAVPAPTTAPAPEAASEPTTPRRSTRMQRYHEAESSDNDSE